MIFSRVKERVRANSGWSGESDLSNNRIAEAINHVYTVKLPDDVNYKSEQDWVYLDISANNDNYAWNTSFKNAANGTVVGTRVRQIIPPLMLIVSNNETDILRFTYDNVGFWTEWPPYANEETGQPLIALSQGRDLWFRPVPGNNYTGKVWAYWRPTSLNNNADALITNWEEATIAGATALLKEDDEDWEGAGSWWQLYEARKNEISRSDQQFLGRVKGNW